MKTSQAGIDLIHSFETLRLKAYPDPGSKDGTPWTVGWGSTGPDIGPGAAWTKDQADARFAKDLARFEVGVSKGAGVSLKQHQFDAMVSFAYNVGLANFLSSTLLKMVNAGDFSGAAKQFSRWDKNDGKVMTGLTRRRKAEMKLFSGEH